MSSSLVDLERLNSADLAIRYAYAIELVEAGDGTGCAILCEALNPQNWKYLDLYKAIDALGNIRAVEAVTPLIDFVNSYNGHARMNALRALTCIGTNEALESVFTELGTLSPWFGWGTAQIVASQGKRYINQLIKLSEHVNHVTRTRSIYALGLIAKEFLLVELLPIFAQSMTDENYNVTSYASYALISLGTQESQNTFSKFLYHTNTGVRLQSAYGLHKLDTRQAEAIQMIIAIMQDKNEFYRQKAVEIAGILLDERVIPELIYILKKDDFYEIRLRAAEALGSFNNPDVIGSLRQGLSDEHERVRAECVKSLEELQGKDILPDFIDLLFDTDHFVSWVVIKAWEKHNFHPTLNL